MNIYFLCVEKPQKTNFTETFYFGSFQIDLHILHKTKWNNIRNINTQNILYNQKGTKKETN